MMPRRSRSGAAVLVALTIAIGAPACSSTGSDHDMAGPTGVPSAVASPGAESVDAGFAYDMSRHHAQAVEMAELVNGRTTDPEIGVLARDIALTQQYQIGEMRGWLDGWGLPATSLAEPMTWMGMSGMDMPGMATDAQLAALRDAPAGDVDRMFLELMIRHHQGGVEMATAAASSATVPYVQALATSIEESQTAEVESMTDLLDRLGPP